MAIVGRIFWPVESFVRAVQGIVVKIGKLGVTGKVEDMGFIDRLRLMRFFADGLGE